MNHSLKPTPADGPLYQLADVNFSIAGKPLLRSVTLDLAAGQVTGLIGHNGSGKTSLVKLLARVYRPTGGKIVFGGRELADWPHRIFAQQVAHLPQYTPATDGLLVRELVSLGRYPWHGALGRFSVEDRHYVDSAMTATDVMRYADRAVDSLSGGERQRVWLAMLIAQNSRCVLLDEPTSALDVGHQLEVLGLVRKLADEHGVTAVVVLHDVNMAARFCNELVALRGGQVLLRSSPDEMMRPDCLEQIYGVPMGVLKDPDNGHAIGFPR
ncbi:ATP-binding cassette domain-containing protein [Paraburkholderia sp. BCC1885]|uniref:ATP-binding cassette domain-containing protein n=1 Tax=Paraburkholderia sp. BCC1885 TaxID=2562669 RepID=UPI0021B297EB|nr:ATP-binding cassette domain-containing protein [Paraburkholderia sp. BCC1885]